MNDSTMSRAARTLHAAPLAQDYTVVQHIADPDVFTATPALLRLPSGRLLCSFSLVTRIGRAPGHPERALGTAFYTTADGGQTWNETGSVDLDDGLVFVHRDRLYLLCNRPGRGDIVVTASDDEGASWREPVTLFAGRFWNTFTPHAVRNDTLYWALGAPNADGNFNRTGARIVAVAGDLAADDLLDRSCWRISPYLAYPGTPAGLSAQLRDDVAQGEVYPADGDDLTASFPGRPADHGDHWLEPNVVNVNGRIRVFVRLRIDRQTTAHLCAVCDVDDDGEELELRYTQLHPLPGNCYFHIIRDEPAGYYWAATSLPTRTQDLVWGREMAARGLLKGRAGNERRFLMLMYSLDALNWFPAGCVAMWPSPGQGFQYNALLVDGDDLLVSSRTAKNAPNQHDNDLVTIHRVRDFRSLALNLHPVV